MYSIRNTLNYEKTKFKDLDALQVFTDNHDNRRFLNINNDRKAFQASLIFSIFCQGIPGVYYGSEQNYGGGNDPFNREQLWTNFFTTTDTFQLLKAAIATRKNFQTWSHPHEERYVLSNFYAFTRGQVLICLTNKWDQVSVEITYHGFKDGTKLCNIFNGGDCVTVQGGKIPITLQNHDTKVYVPSA